MKRKKSTEDKHHIYCTEIYIIIMFILLKIYETNFFIFFRNDKILSENDFLKKNMSFKNLHFYESLVQNYNPNEDLWTLKDAFQIIHVTLHKFFAKFSLKKKRYVKNILPFENYFNVNVSA
jgi:hypothetical protein